jgi:hypothetical protein
MGTPKFSDSAMLRLQWATAAQSYSSSIADEIPNSQQSRRRRPGPGRLRRPVPPAVSQPLDELDRYLSETLVDKNLYQENPVIWWKNVGARRFPRLSLLAADLFFILAFIASVERLFNYVNAIISPRRSCLNRYIIA